MATHNESQVKDLQESALEHLWIYLREPSDMALMILGTPGMADRRRLPGNRTFCSARRYEYHKGP